MTEIAAEDHAKHTPQTVQPPIDHHRWHRALAMVGVLVAPIWLIAGGSLALGAFVQAVRAAYEHGIVESGKEPAFLLTLSFLLTFGVVRMITYAIRAHLLPFLRNITTKSGLHIHHMVPGMLIVLVTGYLGLVLTADRPTRLLAVLFGLGAALVLDEFALWLRLADVYWSPAGRESIDAVVLAGGVGILYLLGFGFWSRLFTEALQALTKIR